MTNIKASNLERLVCIHCPDHAGVLGNERDQKLASRVPILVGTMDMQKSDNFRALNYSMLEIDTAIDEDVVLWLRQFGIQRRSSRNSNLQGRARCIHNQRVTGIISVHTLRYLLNSTEHLWICPECNDVNSINNEQFCVGSCNVFLLVACMLVFYFACRFDSIGFVYKVLCFILIKYFFLPLQI